MQLAVAKQDTQLEVSDATFGAAFNEALVHQVVTAYMAGARAGTKAQKNRAEVRGGGKKPWRQKGTGRARAGTIRSPLWQGGGTHFAAKPRNFTQKVNRKMYRGAMRSILGELVRQQRLTVIAELALEQRKTAALLARLAEADITIGPRSRTVIVVSELDDKLAYSARNVANLHVLDLKHMNPVALVGADTVVMTADAVTAIQEWLG